MRRFSLGSGVGARGDYEKGPEDCSRPVGVRLARIVHPRHGAAARPSGIAHTQFISMFIMLVIMMRRRWIVQGKKAESNAPGREDGLARDAARAWEATV
jgi:hypothetical protein